jgi:hypothetical protein
MGFVKDGGIRMKPKKLKKENYILQDDRRVEQVRYEWDAMLDRRENSHNCQGKTKTLSIELDPQPENVEGRFQLYSDYFVFIPWGINEYEHRQLYQYPVAKNEIIILDEPVSNAYNFKIIHIIGVEEKQIPVCREKVRPAYGIACDKKWFLKAIVEESNET